MNVFLESDRLVILAAIIAVVAFVFNKLAAGALRAAGQDAWKLAKRRKRNRA